MVSWALAYDDRVLVVGMPDVALYDADGAELGRQPALAESETGLAFARGALRRADGSLAVLFERSDSSLYVQEYSSEDLGVGTRTPLPGGAAGAALVESQGKLYVLAMRTDAPEHRFELMELAAGGMVSTTTVPLGMSYRISGVGSVASNGDLILCGVQFQGFAMQVPQVLRFDIVTKELSTIDLSPAVNVLSQSCWLTRTTGSLVAAWEQQVDGVGRATAILLDSDATTVLSASAVHFGDTAEGDLRGPQAALGDVVLMTQWAAPSFPRDRLLQFSALTGTGLDDCRVELDAGTVTAGNGVAVASIDEYVYMASTVAYGGGIIDLRLRRLSIP